MYRSVKIFVLKLGLKLPNVLLFLSEDMDTMETEFPQKGMYRVTIDMSSSPPLISERWIRLNIKFTCKRRVRKPKKLMK